MKKYKTMPPCWKNDFSWGSPDYGCVPICDGKSLLRGGKKGLLVLTKKEIEKEKKGFMHGK